MTQRFIIASLAVFLTPLPLSAKISTSRNDVGFDLSYSQDVAERQPAEIAPPPATLATPAETKPKSRFYGLLETRPSWTVTQGEVHTENWVELGYLYREKSRITYYQEIYTDVYDPTKNVSAFSPYFHDGFIRGRFNGLWTSKDARVTFSYEGRLYTPTNAVTRDAGFITSLRNYLRFTRPISDSISFTFAEVPVVHAYNVLGTTTTANGPVANPIFENWVQFIVEFNLTKEVTFALPLMLNFTRYLNYSPKAKNNDSWDYFLWTYPELIVTVSPELNLGLAFYSDNFLQDSETGGQTLSDGFAKGVFQFVVQVQL